MADKASPATTLDQAFREIRQLRADLQQANRTIHSMQQVGGFADSKMLGQWCTRIEGRLEAVELDGEMLKDVAALQVDQAAAHLAERHHTGDRDQVPDSIGIRRIRRRLAEWAEKRGLTGRRRDLRETRQDENRLRPATS